MKFHEKLREMKGAMSESALAAAAGLPYASVHSYVLGRRTPTFAAVVKLARAVGASCDAFSGCEDIAGDEPPSAPAPEPRRGRPPKPKVETEPAPKKPRGRPRKDGR